MDDKSVMLTTFAEAVKHKKKKKIDYILDHNVLFYSLLMK